MKTCLTLLVVCLSVAMVAGCYSSPRPAGKVDLQVVTKDQVSNVQLYIQRINKSGVSGKTTAIRLDPGSYDVELGAITEKYGETRRYYYRQIVDVPAPGTYVLRVTIVAPENITSYVERVPDVVPGSAPPPASSTP